MKINPYHYAHEANGIAIELVPETETELMLLSALWKFGRMDIIRSAQSRLSTMGYIVRAFKAAQAAGGSDAKD